MYSQFMMHGQKNIKLFLNWFTFFKLNTFCEICVTLMQVVENAQVLCSEFY